jgi:hypothetical protein
VSVCVCERERERERECVYIYILIYAYTYTHTLINRLIYSKALKVGAKAKTHLVGIRQMC